MSAFGRYVMAVAFAAFGVLYLQTLITHASPPGPPWRNGDSSFDLVAAAFFLITAATLVLEKAPRKFVGAAAAFLFAFALVIHAAGVLKNPHNPGPWTSGCEVLALSGALLAASGLLTRLGSVVYGLSLIVVGVQHFYYAPFVAGLVPAWYPFHPIWPYVAGTGFFLAAFALVTGIWARCASICLACMFGLWVVTLHVPRVMGKPHDGNEWTSLIVCLAFAGGALVLAGSGSGARKDA